MDAISFALEILKTNIPYARLSYNVPMKDHTSFKIGGPVRAMLFPKTADEVEYMFNLLQESGASPLIIGNGTNLLVSEEPQDLVVINMLGLCDIEQTGEYEITAQTGVLLSKLAVFACERNMAGLEFAHGIPGSLGGAICMNAGAYGGQMSDVVSRTQMLNPIDGKVTVIGDEHDFSYRSSRFAKGDELILSSVIKLRHGEASEIKAEMDGLFNRRRESQPLSLPSAGSTFKRPANGYAGTMIDKAGLKGYTVGGAQVSEKHAGFVVNCGGATFSDVMAVIEHVRETVFKQFGIELELEVKVIS